MNSNLQLTKWDEYISKLGGKAPARGMSVFHARFKLAQSIVGLSAPGIRSQTIDVYSELCRLGFAYAALDFLESNLKIVHHPEIYASDLAMKVRTGWPQGLEIISRKMEVNPTLYDKLVSVFTNNSQSNVRPVVEILRHATFHGSFTPSGWKLHSRESLELLSGLSQVTLRKADETFTDWFDANF